MLCIMYVKELPNQNYRIWYNYYLLSQYSLKPESSNLSLKVIFRWAWFLLNPDWDYQIKITIAYGKVI